MRVGVIGGGPGGLYLARLLRLRRPDIEVHVYERNAPDSTSGFGVAFSPKTLGNLAAADPETHASIAGGLLEWDGMAMRHAGRDVRWPGFGLGAIDRAEILRLLQHAARAVGAELHFESPVGLDDMAGFDVVVAADGAHSQTRAALEGGFLPSVELGRAKYMWLGSTGPFDITTFSVRTDEAGTFAIHAYPYGPSRATIVAETDEQTWRRAGFAGHSAASSGPGVSDERSVAYLAELFAPDLDGHRVLVNNTKWLNFPHVRSERWSDGNVVLLGDAAHTAHPSVASGTKLAMEDAIVLAEELAGEHDLARAFATYEARRRPDAEHIQRRAVLSQRWWETVHRRVGMSVEQLAVSFLTRAGAADFPKLERIAPALTRSALASSGLAGSALDGSGAQVGGQAVTPLDLPLTVSGRSLSRRVLSPVACGDGPRVRVLRGRSESLLAAVGQARSGDVPELIAAEVEPSGDADLADMSLVVALGRAGCDIIALPLGEPGRTGSLAERVRCELGLPVLRRCGQDQLDQAATDVLAGRADLIEVTRPDGPAGGAEGAAGTYLLYGS